MRLLPAEALVADVMTRDVVTLSRFHSLPLAQSLMQLGHLRHIPVVDDERRLVGLVTHRDLLAAQISSLAPLSEDERTTLQIDVPVSKIMHREVWTVAATTPVARAAQLLRDHRFGCLPVTHHGRLIGIVTESDILRLVAEPGPVVPPPGAWPIKRFMTPAPVTIFPDTTLADARLAFERYRIHHLPVVDAHGPIGIVHERDVGIAEAIFDARETRAAHVASILGRVTSVVAHPEDPLGGVIARMVRERVDAVLVAEAHVLAGIFTLLDGCRILAELTE